MTERRFGVEIEFIAARGITRERVADKLTGAGVPAYSTHYSDHRVVPGKWKVKPDGSLYGGNGMEVVSPPITGQDGLDAVTKASAVLLDPEIAGAVNRSCGLHVHLDCSDLNIETMKRLVTIYKDNEGLIDALLPPSRRGNTNPFAMSLKHADMAALKAARTSDQIAKAVLPRVDIYRQRYAKVNFKPFGSQGTIEFRQHSGTVDAEKINQWIRLCQQLVAVAVKEQDLPITAPSQRPVRSKKMALAFDMISRPDGASAEELRVATNRRTMTSWGYWFNRYNIGYRMSQGRYHLDERTLTQMTPATLDEFMTKLEMSEEQRAFWTARVNMLRGATSMEITT
jgi:hypothetical protein